MLVDETFCKSVGVGFGRCIAGREGKCMCRVNIFDGRYKIVHFFMRMVKCNQPVTWLN